MPVPTRIAEISYDLATVVDASCIGIEGPAEATSAGDIN
jgi:hypothetical protein